MGANANGATSESVPGSVSKPPQTWKRALQGGVSLAIVVGIFVGVMPQIANYGDVWATIRNMTRLEIGSLVLIGFWNLVTYWFVLVAALPGLRLREAAVVNQASTAVSNTLPGGGAIGVGVTVAMLRSWGFSIATITRSAIVTGIWNNFVKLGMPVLALALLAAEGGVSAGRAVAAVFGVGALVAAVAGLGFVLKSDAAARAVGSRFGRVVDQVRRWLRRPSLEDWGDRAARFRGETIGLLRHRWVSLTVATVVSHVSLYLVLLAGLRNVGVSQEELSWIAALAAFAFVRLVSALPITPGESAWWNLGMPQ